MASLLEDLGTRVLGAKDSEQALQMSQLNFTVGLRPVHFFDSNSGDNEFEGHFVVVREPEEVTTGEEIPFAVVRSRYTIVQNEEALCLLNPVSGPKKDLSFEKVGVFDKGKLVWILFRVENLVLEPVPGTKYQCYVILSTSHDGSQGVRVSMFAENEKDKSLFSMPRVISLRHTKNVTHRMDQAQRIIGAALDNFDAFEDMLSDFGSTRMGPKEWEAFLEEMIPEPLPDNKRPGTANNARDYLTEQFLGRAGGWAGQSGQFKGTRLAALQAVMSFVTHKRSARGGDSGRLQSVWFGSGSNMLNKAMGTLKGNS